MERKEIVNQLLPHLIRYATYHSSINTPTIQKVFHIGYGVAINALDELERLNIIKHTGPNEYQVLIKGI